MLLTAKICMVFRDEYAKKSEIKLQEKLNKATDIYHREIITVLGRAINQLCEKSTDSNNVATAVTIKGQKDLKLLMGHFLIQNLDARSKMVVDFVQVLHLFQDELFEEQETIKLTSK